MKPYEYYEYYPKDEEIKIRVPKLLKDDLIMEAKDNQVNMSKYILQRLCIDDNDNGNAEIKRLRRRNERLYKKNRAYKESAFRIATCINQIKNNYQTEESFDCIDKEITSWLLKWTREIIQIN